MPDDPRVQRLIEEMLDSGRSPEEVCRDTPELLPGVRDGWRRFQAVEARIDELFPEPGSIAGRDSSPFDEGPIEVPGYDIVEVLGRGGVGVVYKAVHRKLHRTVALKMLLAGAFATRAERRRFAREAELVAGLRHPNVVQVYDVGDLDGRPYFTMEFVDGGSLAQRIAGTPLPAPEAAGLVAILADAVAAAHRAGVVHRDLKPSNVVLTASGIPKVTDFGLARDLEAWSSLTQTGAAVGTPSYMAPEQAQGRTGQVGPASDVYALGAVLYELLTGRPPFRAESGAETVYQVITQDPVPPSRLNARVPRDLDTICLKCLRKDPRLRYAGAEALADDLRRFGDGRPIQARRSGWGERGWRWARRHPAAAELVVTALVLLVGALVGGFWLSRQQAERRTERAREEGRRWQAVESALAQATAMQAEGRWYAARAALEGAPSLLGISAPASLRGRLDRARANASMVIRLDEIRLSLLEGQQGRARVTRTGDQLYEEAFRDHGIAVKTMGPSEAAARVRDSAIREALLAFLHDWLYWVSGPDRDRLRSVVERADDDAWRRGLREALAVNDAPKLKEFIRAREAVSQPPVILSGLAGALYGGPLAEDARALLQEAQKRHPEDFWINFQLGYLLHRDRPGEAVGYSRAAVASRPRSGQALSILGRALRDAGDLAGAADAFRMAIALNAHRGAARDLARVLASMGRLEEARVAWQEVLADDPPEFDSWDGYAQLCAYIGNEEAYRGACKDLLDRFGGRSDHWTTDERNSVACLILPSTGEPLRRACDLADRAVRVGPKFPDPDHAYIQFVQGLAAYRRGRHERAIPLLREASDLLPNRPGPRLVLAMAQFRSGSPREARQTLAAAAQAYDWSASQANHATAWVSHVLRREAEALILPDLPAFLRGDHRPRDNDERLAFVAACQSRGLHLAAARLYADAFAADPTLADRLTAECRRRSTREEPFYDRIDVLNTESRYLAARCAALTAGGLGADAHELSEPERTQWGGQARAWLNADLVAWARTLDGGRERDRDLVNRMLTHWQSTPELAGVREPSGLKKLRADERQKWFALWDEVDAVRSRIAHSDFIAQGEPKHWVLLQQGRLEDAIASWRAALAADPLDHHDWFGYAELCLYLGHEDEYRQARRDLLARFGSTVDPYVAERTSRSCLLLPADGEDLRRAVSLAERAVAAGRANVHAALPWFLSAQGLAEYRQGRLERAISTMRGEASRVIGPAPRLIVAMALFRSGQASEARRELAAAVLAHDWRTSRVRDRSDLIVHILRREAEALILPDLLAFLRGDHRPRDNDERLAMLGACQAADRPAAAARLYAEAFAADPRLADDPAAGRYNAARAAALAGVGRGADAAHLAEVERRRWREQARRWLRAELAVRRKSLAHPSAGASPARQSPAFWRDEPDLAGLREPAALEDLSEDERKDCLALWVEVGRLDELARRAR